MNLGLSGSLKVIGIDEGYFPPEFKRKRLQTILVAVLCDWTTPLDVKISRVTVDYDNVNDRVLELLGKFKVKSDLIILDGVTYAGFNVIDPKTLNEELGIPIITVFKHNLNMDRIRTALYKHFNDWRYRFTVIWNVYSNSRIIHTPWRPLRISVYGIDENRAIDLIIRLQKVSPIPEPLRLADVIASGLTKNSGLLNML
ncbi:MAG: hypothetical protein B6U85_00775 [Desulfurococcales archaeon ex4484_42]|nr:MAG: hypothetical protein B6U85_00775 [Desulfurococcales archaeon ex4484_42]